MTTVANCSLCRADLEPLLMSSAAWHLVVNHNQNLLGKCFLSLKHHEEAVTALTINEWMDLHIQLKRVTRMLVAAFQPDHFNYVFLQNQDRHVHMHIIPRYAASREYAGVTFTDPDYPSHYAVPSPVHRLAPDQMSVLVFHLQIMLNAKTDQ
jgi:diadenosine tetraphosphate (Ap4A) HIT family hydrolase